MKKSNPQQLEMERIFMELGPRPILKVTIRRAEPKWCAKYLGTIDVDDEEDFSLDEIQSLYGGGKFYLKIKNGSGRYLEHRTVKICGRPTENGFPVLRAERVEPGRVKLLDRLLTELRPESSTGDDEQEALAARIEELEGRVEELEARQREAEDIAQKALEMIRREAAGKDPTFYQRQVLAELQRMRQPGMDINKLIPLFCLAFVMLVAKNF